MTLSWDVLVPAFDAEATVGAAVASALAQDPPPSRVLVYSDGSNDDTAQRAREAGAEVLEARENRGVGYARQVLLEHATSPWFLVLDADDRLLPDAGRRLTAAVAAHPEAWVLGFGATADTASAPEDQFPCPAGPGGARGLSLRALWSRNRLISSSTLIRRDPAVRAGGFPDVRRLVDYAFWLVLAADPRASGRIWEHSAPLTARSIDAGTITGNVVAAVLAERDLLVQHAPAALAGLPAWRRRLLTTARLCELWWRGLSRHLDYGHPADAYLPPERVVPGVIVPRALRLLTHAAVQQSLRSAAALVRGRSRLPAGSRRAAGGVRTSTG
jgi:hypothetical protein